MRDKNNLCEKPLEFSLSQYRVHSTSYYTVSLLAPLFPDFHSSSIQRATLFPILSSSRQFFVRWTRISYALAPSFPSSPSLALRVILLPPSSSSPPPTYLHHDFSSLRSGSRPRVPTKWAARARAHGTQLKVSHTGGHAVPRRDDRIDPSLRSQIPACRLFSAVLPSRSHRNRFAVTNCPRSPHFASTNPAILATPYALDMKRVYVFVLILDSLKKKYDR